MDDLTLLMFLVLVVAPLMSLMWWGFVFYAAFRFLRQFEHQLDSAENLTHQWQASPAAQRAAVQGAWLEALGKMNRQYGQLKQVQQQRYENRRAELIGVAASAGFTAL